MGFFWSQITELLIGCWLFEFGANGTKWDAEEDHLARMTEALGTPFDPSFLSKCDHKNKFFKEDGESTPTWYFSRLTAP